MQQFFDTEDSGVLFSAIKLSQKIIFPCHEGFYLHGTCFDSGTAIHCPFDVQHIHPMRILF